jgi:hypothetical protein
VTAAPETTPPPVDLTPFVPRVVVDWLRVDPEARRRELEGTLVFVDISGSRLCRTFFTGDEHAERAC